MPGILPGRPPSDGTGCARPRRSPPHKSPGMYTRLDHLLSRRTHHAGPRSRHPMPAADCRPEARPAPPDSAARIGAPRGCVTLADLPSSYDPPRSLVQAFLARRARYSSHSVGRRYFLATLHALHAGTTFPFVERPPRTRGTRWSIVSSRGAVGRSQYPHRPAASRRFHQALTRSTRAFAFSRRISASETELMNATDRATRPPRSSRGGRTDGSSPRGSTAGDRRRPPRGSLGTP